MQNLFQEIKSFFCYIGTVFGKFYIRKNLRRNIGNYTNIQTL